MNSHNGTDLGISPDAEQTVKLAQRPRQPVAAPAQPQRQPAPGYAGPAPSPHHPTQWPAPTAAPWPPPQPFNSHGGYAHPGWAPAGPGPNTSRRNLLIVAAVAVVVLIALVLAVVMAGGGGNGGGGGTPSPSPTATTTTTPKPEKKPIPASALSRVMLSASELSDVVGTTMTPGVMWDSLSDPKLVDDECLPVALPASARLYRSSGYTGVQVQSAESAAKDPRTSQSVISFPDDEAAADFVKNEAQPAWEKCANRTVNYQSTDPTNPMNVFWRVGAITQTDGLMTVTRVQEGSDSGWECHQGLVAQRNVVLDFYVCGRGVSESVMTSFADEFGKNVDRQK